MSHLDQLDNHPEAARIRSRRLSGNVATLVVDATGLDEGEQKALEQSLREAALAIPGIEEARVAMTAARRGRTLVAIGSGKGGVGKSTARRQSGGGAGADGQEGRAGRRRHLRPVAAEPVRRDRPRPRRATSN